MNDLNFYTPKYVPPEILVYESELLQLKPEGRQNRRADATIRGKCTNKEDRH